MKAAIIKGLLPLALLATAGTCAAADGLRQNQGKWGAIHRKIENRHVKERLPGDGYDFFPVHGIAIRGDDVWIATYNLDFEPVVVVKISPCSYLMKKIRFNRVLKKSKQDPLAAYRDEKASFMLEACDTPPVLVIRSSKGVESIFFKARQGY